MHISRNLPFKALQQHQNVGKNRYFSSMKRASTGDRLSVVGERSSSLALSERFRNQVRNSGESLRVIQNGLNLIQTADSWLQEVHGALQRMSELAVLTLDSSKNESDRANANQEFLQLKSEIGRIASDGLFNRLNVVGPGAPKVIPLDSSSLSSASSLPPSAPSSSGPSPTPIPLMTPHVYRMPGGAEENLEELHQYGGDDHVANFVVNGDDWEDTHFNSSSGVTELTYSYSNLFDGGLTGVTNDEAKQAIEEALEIWATYGNITFTETDDTGPAPDGSHTAYAPSTHPNLRFGHHAIDGAGNTLAHAFYPTPGLGISGDTHFDSGETWTPGMFLETAVHEIGHALGIGHETTETAIMNSTFKGVMPELGTALLYQDDIDAIQSLYGSRPGDTFTFQVGPDSGMQIDVTASNVQIDALSLGGANLENQGESEDALEEVMAAIDSVALDRSRLGAAYQRLQSTFAAGTSYHDHIGFANSRLRDTDFAFESAELVKGEMLLQSSTAVQSQANVIARNITMLFS